VSKISSRSPCNPETILGEVLGERAVKGADPAAKDFQCPFLKSRCVKRTTNLSNEEPYPVCSIWRRPRDSDAELIFLCPKRFFAIDFLQEVIEHCWSGDKPLNPRFAPEVKMKGFGNVDFVIADVDDDGAVTKFLSVELQAIDITGSAFPLYEALRAGVDYEGTKRPGLNWDNVYKRYVTQLIRKGYFHHHWGSKIVAVIPDQVYKYITTRADFMRSTDVRAATVNVIFMTYRLTEDPQRPGEYKPELVTVEGTSHSNLQNAILYAEPPSQAEFRSRIERSLVRAVNLSELVKKVKFAPFVAGIETGTSEGS
jgi:hypothetical protein